MAPLAPATMAMWPSGMPPCMFSSRPSMWVGMRSMLMGSPHLRGREASSTSLSGRSFDGHGFGEISWSIHVEVQSECRAVGQQLQRQDGQQR